MKRISFKKVLITAAILFIAVSGISYAQNNDWWTERITWDDGSSTVYIMSHNWDTLERVVRDDWSIRITIEGSQWNTLRESELNYRFANMMRSNLVRGTDSITAMAVYTRDRLVTSIVVICAERQSDGSIAYWDTYWDYE